jgi:hypothetical protein
MVEKRDINPLGTPSDDGSFSEIQNEFEDCYHGIFDSAFFALGRNIVLHLTPEKTIDSSGLQASTPALRYNPFDRRGGRMAPNQISTTRTPAVKLVHRDATYVAQIKHGPRDSDDKGGIELLKDEVATTLVLEARPHVEECQSATIDGSRYVLESIRPIGFRDVRYIICKWKAINEVQNG